MKRIFIERAIVYSIALIYLILSCNIMGNQSIDTETNYINNVTTTMKQLGYIKEENSYINDLVYTQDDNYLKIDYFLYSNTIRTTMINGKVSFTNIAELNSIYEMIENLFDTNLGFYNSEIKVMVDKYKATEEKQSVNEIRNGKQIVIDIYQSNIDSEEFQLDYRIHFLN